MQINDRVLWEGVDLTWYNIWIGMFSPALIIDILFGLLLRIIFACNCWMSVHLGFWSSSAPVHFRLKAKQITPFWLRLGFLINPCFHFLRLLFKYCVNVSGIRGNANDRLDFLASLLDIARWLVCLYTRFS